MKCRTHGIDVADALAAAKHHPPRTASGDDTIDLGDLGSDNIFNGAIARDGKVAISRGTSSNDVVLIRAK